LTSYLNKITALSVITLLVLSGCATARQQASTTAPGMAGEKAIIPTPLNEGMLRAAGAPEEYIETHAVRPTGEGFKKAALVAVLPIENLSGTEAPLGEIRRAYIDKLKARGIAVLSDNVLEGFMAKHRVRFTGGIGRDVSSSFAKELGVQGVLITSLELYSAGVPPKIAIVSRLVTTGPKPQIKWMADNGMAGDDHRGLLDLGLIVDIGKLTDKSLKRLSDSLAASLSGVAPAESRGGRRFRPKYFYKSPDFDIGQRYSVAVAPFFNRTESRYADEIMMLQFIEHLYNIPGLEVIEPGVVREDLLRHRVVMDEGLNLGDIEIMTITLDADLIFMGRVLDYQDYQQSGGTPKVDFTVQVVERKDRQVVWSSKSRNEGNQGVFFFDFGMIRTADKMASEMVDNVVREMRAK
jgi:TolB-like protein